MARAIKVTPRGAKYASRLRAKSTCSFCQEKFQLFEPIYIQMQVQRMGPISFMSKMKHTAMAKRKLITQQSMHIIRLQQLFWFAEVKAQSLASSSYAFRADFLIFSSDLRAYYSSQTCLVYKNSNIGTRTKYSTMKDRQRQIMASMKAGCLIAYITLKVFQLQYPIKHIQMNASYPKPNPLKRGPNSKMTTTFQQLFLERAMVPVRQMKKRMVSMGYSTAMIQAPMRTFVKQTTSSGRVNMQYMMKAPKARVESRAVKIIRGQEGEQFVCSNKQEEQLSFRKSARQFRGARTTLCMTRNITIISLVVIQTQSHLVNKSIRGERKKKDQINIETNFNLNVRSQSS